MVEATPPWHDGVNPDDTQEASTKHGDERRLHRLAHASQNGGTKVEYHEEWDAEEEYAEISHCHVEHISWCIHHREDRAGHWVLYCLILGS